MANNYNDLSTWRNQIVTAKPGVTDVDFIDTKPNMFVVQNTTPYHIFVSISKTPSKNSYEFKIMANTTVTLGRPTPTSKLYIFNPVNVDLQVQVWSINDIFDMNILKNNNITLDSEMEVRTEGIVKGFESGVSIPAGNNHVGEVSIDPDNIDQIMDIPAMINEKSENLFGSLMSAEISATMVNLKSLLNSINDVAETIAGLSDRLLKTHSSESINGAYTIDTYSYSTFSTNNWWDMWKHGGKYGFKVSDFATATECEVQSADTYNGVTEQKSVIAYVKLSVDSADRVVITINNPTEGYIEKTYTAETITDINGVKYVSTHDLFLSLVEFLWGIHKPTVTPDINAGYKGVNFSTAKTAYSYAYSSSQQYNYYSGAFANMPKCINVLSEFNGMYSIEDSIGVNICSPITSESAPVKIMDRIEILSNNTDYEMTLKLYYNFSDYIEVVLQPHDFLSDLNMEIYNIGVKVDTTDFTGCTVSVYGGLF